MYSLDKFTGEIYNSPFENTKEEEIELLRNKSITRMRTKSWISGDMLEVEIYPVYVSRRAAERQPKAALSRPAQRELNKRNAIKKLVRLINTNFKAQEDIWVHLTYDDAHLPKDISGAYREIRNYIKRLKRYAEKHNFPELKYIYVTEGGSKKRYHHHLVTNFPDRDVAERLWTAGEYPRANRLMDSAFKFEGMARYMGKGNEDSLSGARRFVTSKNLKKPIKHVADFKFSKTRVHKIATGRESPKEIFEKTYKGYKYLDMHNSVSPFYLGLYTYVRMRR